MFDIPNRIRFLKTHHNGDTSLAQDSLLTSGTNLQWQEILNDLLLGSYHYSRKKKAQNHDISFQKDVIDFSDDDAVAQRISLINYYLSSCLLKDDFDDCYITKYCSCGNFDDFYFFVKADDTSFPLHLGKEKYRKIFYSKVLIKNTSKRSADS
ncbi:hypothetical protein [Bartonella sp. ML70XJBT.G]|uniref:hypothetical protein n=1 Tax=Bartonella sp. ML70XJBT.G TaxID=3019093 RepID=UPI0023607168|nr:hypothetical protein [Bartonella sp. ML70XJBT.G]